MNTIGARAIIIVFTIHLVATLLTAGASAWAGTPFALWFKDTAPLLLAVLVLTVVLGIVWDGSLITLGLVAEKWIPRKTGAQEHVLTVASMRKLRFFTCGSTPILLIVATAYAILGTSNITLISLKMLGGATEWRDHFFWSIEEPIFVWLQGYSINTAAWDRLYHSCWLIQLCAAFALVVIGRSTRIVVQFSVSLILLFYIGRFLGLFNPVMGPALYRPDLFGYLHGSFTNAAMQQVTAILSLGPTQALEKGGILLGGVSAMPSLHVAMVAVTAYWLGIAKRWTLFVTAPWVMLVWVSTVLLGWHYVLDGAGGIVLGGLCIGLTRFILAHFPLIPEEENEQQAMLKKRSSVSTLQDCNQTRSGVP